jgi:integrase
MSGEFHDIRSMCLTKWFANGLKEFDVMTMAGHSSFETTRRFYLVICGDLLDKTSKVIPSMSIGSTILNSVL